MKNLKRLLSAVLAFIMTTASAGGLLITPTIAWADSITYYTSPYKNNATTFSSSTYITDVTIIEEDYVESYIKSLIDGLSLDVTYYYESSPNNKTTETFTIDANSLVFSTTTENVTAQYTNYGQITELTRVDAKQSVTLSNGYVVDATAFQGRFLIVTEAVIGRLNALNGTGLDLIYPISSISIENPYDFYYGKTYNSLDIFNDFTIKYTNVSMDRCYLPSFTGSWSDGTKEISLYDYLNDYTASALNIAQDANVYISYTSGNNSTTLVNATSSDIADKDFTLNNKTYDGISIRLYYIGYENLLDFHNNYTKAFYSYSKNFSFHKPTSISVDTAPTTVVYTAGEYFDPSGMVIKLNYDDKTSEEITDYSYDTQALIEGQTEMYITYDGLYTTVPITVTEKEVTSIAVTTQPSKTDYVVGQSLDTSGMVITATYTDGSTAKVDNDLLTYVYSESDYDYFEYAGTTEYITVGYGGKTAKTTTFTVKAKTITGLSVTTYPDKVSYYVGEKFNSSGMKVTATYNDGSSAVISDYSISPETITSATTAVTVSKDGHSDEVKITVTENAVVGIEVTEQPTRTSYDEGDNFDPSGMVVTATYTNGYEEEITDYSYSSINGTGSVTVYITYGSFYDTVTVNVAAAAVVTMTGITVSSAPTKTTYVAGESFDKSGMVIKAVYSDGSTSEITDYKYSPTILSESDTNIIVTYGNFYTTIPVSVSTKEITKIEVTTAPTKMEYVQGEVFNDSGMVVTATYSDNTTADLASSEYSYSSEPLTTLGNINFEISAANCTATTPITVIEKEISSISVTQYPDKVSYYDGQSFDSSGMIVQASYNDGSTAVILDYTVSPTVLTSGDTEVTVSKDGFSDVVKITVSEKSLSKIAVTSQPNTISYIAGETFNSSGMTVTAYYNDDSYETITDYTITNPTMTAGTDTVYITYEGLYATVSVSVTEKTVTGIEVSEQPSKTSYIAGEAFDTSGMVINLNYSDGSYEEITNYNYSPVTLGTGDTSVLITYGNYFATVSVSVAAKEITGIEIETYPDKVTYVEGEVFDDSGMVVLATYNDGSTSYLASNEYTYSTDPLTISNYYVTIYAGDVSNIVPVRVIDKEITNISVTEYPNKVSYYAGQTFDSTGMIVEASYNDSTTAIITDYTVSPETITSGTTEVKISKDGYSDTVKISVSDVALKSIAVTTPPTKTSYYAGETFNSSGMVVTGYFNDGSSSEITDYTISNSTLSSGTTLVYITYDGLYAATSVTVSDKTITGIEIASQPVKTSYVAGQTFDGSGMIVNAVYSDGSTAEVTGYAVSPSTLGANDTSVLVTYGNYFASVPVSVVAKEIESINIVTDPSKVDYVEGEVFDPSGMLVEAVYNDGSTSYLTSNEYTYSTSALTTSDRKVTISAGDVSAYVEITVVKKEITGISITEYPDKISYVSGQSFDPSGMTVMAEYNDSTTAIITDYSYTPSIISSGTSGVVISKNGYSDTVKVSVSDKAITSIAVTTAPTKISYTASESFDPSGMILTGYYNDGTSTTITDYTVTNSILSVGTTAVYITYDNLYASTPVSVAAKSLTAIEITTQPAKTSYVSGQAFDPSGMVVIGLYNDGTTSVLSDYSYSPVTLSTGDTSVIVTYSGFFASVPVSVTSKEITGITITTQPDKVVYVEGEVFDDSGMVVSAEYNDGSTAYLSTSEYSYSKLPLTTNDLSITINAGNVSAIVPIKVIDKTITSIAVTTSPDKIDYIVGQSFDKTGMVITATYNDNTTAEISDYTYSPSIITSNTSEIIIGKDGCTTAVKITVSEKALKSISVTTAPTKTVYVAGESFDNSGMVVTGLYNDGSSEEIIDYVVSNSTMTSGTSLVYITYDNLYATTAVTVTDKVLTGITVTSQPSKTSYVAGENFSTDGLIITAEYNDGTSEEITNYSYSPVSLSTSDTSVMITYGNYFVTIPVSVVAKEITSIEIETYPDKVTYVEGEVFDDSGMIVLATYNDGSTSYLAANEYSYSTDPLTTSDFYVTITAGSVSDIVPIRVIDKTITSISVIEYPDKVSYIAGQSFDSTGMVVEATYNDGATAIITDYTVSPETITADTTEVTVSKDGYSDTVKISVSDVALTSIAVTTSPSKISYYAGQTFDSTGMVVMGYYNDGSLAEITDYTISNPVMTSGTNLVYVTYDNLYTTVAVSVSEKSLTGISIEQQPDTVSYIAGQTFDNTGMIVLANYSDGTSEEITDYSVSPSVLSINDTAILITYESYFASVSVSVAAKEVESISIASAPSKTEYIEGETFNTDGLIVEVVYNDGSIEYVTGGSSELSYSTDPLTVNDEEITVTVGGKTADVPISVVKKEIVGIAVTESPSKISYVVGETVDLSGIEVEATYNDSSKAIIEDYEYSPSTISADTTEIIVSKDGYSDSVSIVVSEKAIVSLDVTKQPDNSSYFAGQTFDPTGMAVSITYNDGTTEEINDYSIINPVLSLDTDCVYITYSSLFTTVPVTVSEKVLTDIAVTTQPDIVSYVVGQSFNTDGMVVTGYFTDGSTEEITDYEIDTDTLILGQTKVYITYSGYYDVVNVSVVAKEVVGVEIISEPTKDDYVEGEIFNPEGLVIKVVYNDGEEEIMTYDNEAISYPTEPLTTNDTTVDITVGGISAEVEISVVYKEITGIQVTTSPTKIDYIVGQNFNPDGMIVTAYYNDNTSAEISDYSFTPETVSMNTNEITIIKDGFTDTVKIAVSERVITNIEVTTPPNKTEYTENDTFDPAGMTVTAYFNDGSQEEITNYSVDDFLLSAGTSVVYVTYENLFATVDIKVNSKSIVAIEIITPPVNVEYIEGQQFDITGMVVKAYYDDDSSAILESYDYEPNGSLTLEDSIITISKDGATAEQQISVIERVVTGIAITKNPDKTDYTEGDVFNPDGMEVVAEYNDGSTEIITDYTYPTEPLSEGDTSVIISYDNFTAEVPITLSVDDIFLYISERNGDVNRDGSVSQKDALILMRFLANTADFSEYAIHTGDVDGDGVLSDKDVTLINNHISGNSTLNETSAIEADIDGDGEVSENDLNLVRKAVLNMWSLDVVYEANADANDDGEINMLDVIWILTHFKKATTIDYIYIASQPDKVNYVEGQSFDPEGMVVKAVYLDGSEEIISDYTYSLDVLEIGDTSIEIEYESFTAEVEITVVEKRIGFDTTENSTETTTENNSETTTNTSDSSTETTTNNTSDSSTETTTESNSDGSTETTTEGGNSDSTTEATTEYNYGNSEGVVIVSLPNKVNYVEGEIFDPAGILIMLYWNDGTTSYITENDVTIDETPLSVGDVYGVIYYEYKNDTEKINVPITVVEKKAVSAEIVTMPDKTEYNEGDSFDPDGMEVEVTYNDGSKEIIPDEDVIYDDTPLTLDDDSVVVSADGIEVEVPIIVNETTTESTTEATTENTETTTKKSSGGGSGSSSSHTTTETTTEATTESNDSDSNGDTGGTNDTDNSENENTDSENSDNNGNSSNGFTDVVGHWAEKYIEHLHSLGIVNGVTDSLYSPDLSTKRGDFAVVLNRLLDLEDGNVTFDDVDSDSYYAQSIANCAEANIFIGYGDGTFKPEQTISRQEMFIIMAKLFAGADYDFGTVELTALDSFADGSAVSEWAKPYTAYLVSIGAVVGDDNELRPTDYITRAEMAAIIYNYIN